ncbi:MAG: sodium:calcium antiporter [Planctomycetota bacterium]|nr:MAG: sodium:calcium antiporter [Planctomycetota bacterium]
MTGLVIEFVALAAVVIAAGVVLARCCDRIAELSGLGRSLVGLVLLASATSLPEFTVGWNAVRIGAIDLTVGDVLGSSLINLLILSVLDLVSRQRGQMLSKMAAAHALSATTAILLTTIVLISLLLETKLTLWRFGPGTLGVLAAYVLTLRLVYFDQQFAMQQEPKPEEAETGKWGKYLLGFVGGAGVILFAGPRLAHTADQLAVATGLGRTFFGTVFVAGITSLPEVVTTIEALRLGARDMAVGNVFGSNAFNMIVPAVADLASPESILSLAAPTHAITAAAVILVTAVATLGLLYRAEKRFWFIEPDAALVTLLIVGALVLVYARR